MRNKEYVRECPPKLKPLIDMANLLPSDFRSEFVFYHAYNPYQDIESNIRKFKELVEDDLPEEFIKANPWISRVINQETITLESSLLKSKKPDFTELISLYEDELALGKWMEIDMNSGIDSVINPLQKLRGVTDVFNPLEKLSGKIYKTLSYRKDFHTIIDWNDLPLGKKKSGFQVRTLNPWVKLNEGIVSFNIFEPVLELIATARIDIRRILQCPICLKIAWKKKATAKSCGDDGCVQRQKYLNKKREAEIKEENDRKRKAAREKWLDQDFSDRENKINGTL